MPQDLLIQLFLSSPTEELLSTIDDRDLVLSLLRNLPDSAQKLYFFYCRGEKMISLINLIKVTIREGNTDLFYDLYDLIPEDVSKYCLTECAKVAAEYGREEELEQLIGDDIDHSVIVHSAKGGHKELVYDLIGKANNINARVLSEIASGAASGGHRDIVYEMISLAEKNNYPMSNRKFITIASGAAEGCQQELHDEMLAIFRDNGGYMTRSEYNEIAQGAARGGNSELVHEMIEKGNAVYFDLIAEKAAEGGHLDIVKDMISRDVEQEYELITTAAAKEGHLDIIIYVMDLETDSHHGISWEETVRDAAKGGHTHIVDYVLKRVRDELTKEYLL